MIVGDVFLNVKADSKDFAGELDRQVSPGVAGVAAKAAATFAVAFAAKKVFDFAKEGLAAAQEAAKVSAQTEAVIKSTGGAANVSAAAIDKLAGSISRRTGIEDDSIKSAQNLLLTFTQVQNRVGEGNDIFNRATMAMVDMGAAMGTDAKSSAIQLGKALNDPVAGISALTRVGVTFTEDQKKVIESLVQTGDVAGAQKVILDELGKEFGGSAEAQATAAGKFTNAIGELQESIGVLLLPAIEGLAQAGLTIVDAFERMGTTGQVLAGIVAAFAVTVTAVTVATKLWAVTSQAMAVVNGVLTAAQWALNAALLANPIGLVVLAIAGLVAALVLAYQHSDTFRAIVQAAFGAVAGAAGWVVGAVGNIIGWFAKLPGGVAGAVGGVVEKVAGLPGRIMGALGNLDDLLFDAGRNVIEGLIRGISSMIGKVGDAIGKVTKKIRDALPFSPAKEGPLSGAGSPDLAGAKIATMIASGITSKRASVAASAADLAGIVAGTQFAANLGFAAQGATTTTTTQGTATVAGAAAGPTIVLNATYTDPDPMEWVKRAEFLAGAS